MASPKHWMWIAYCSLVVAACSVQSPEAISTNTQTAVMLNTTQRSPTVPTPLPTSTLIPSETPLPSSTPDLTPPPRIAIPVASPVPSTQYRLRGGESVQDAQHALEVSSIYWRQILESYQDKSDALNPLQKHLAILAREALWRFPGIPDGEAVAWSEAHHLAMSGDQSATQLLSKLVEAELTRSSVSDPTSLILGRTGFDLSWMTAENLLGDGSRGWLLVGTLPQAESNGAGGGAVMAVVRLSDQTWEIKPIYSFWQPYFGDTFAVFLEGVSSAHSPQVIVEQGQQHGMGWSFREGWICSYGWKNGRWAPLLGGSTWDPSAAASVGSPASEECLTVSGGFGELAVAASGSESGSYSLEFTTLFDPYGCGGWMLDHSLRWMGGQYRHDVTLVIAPDTDLLATTYCVDGPWRFDGQLVNPEDAIVVMEDIQARCDESVSLGQDQCASFLSPRSRDSYRFHLARLYALAGQPAISRELFAALAEEPADPNDQEWAVRARSYLQNLGNLAAAEQTLTSELWPVGDRAPRQVERVVAASSAARTLLFDQATSDQAETVLREALSSRDWDVECAASPDEEATRPQSIHLYWQNECALVYYLLGLVRESTGDDQLAVEAYWHVLHDFPESVYAIVVETKLVIQQE